MTEVSSPLNTPRQHTPVPYNSTFSIHAKRSVNTTQAVGGRCIHDNAPIHRQRDRYTLASKPCGDGALCPVFPGIPALHKDDINQLLSYAVATLASLRRTDFATASSDRHPEKPNNAVRVHSASVTAVHTPNRECLQGLPWPHARITKT